MKSVRSVTEGLLKSVVTPITGAVSAMLPLELTFDTIEDAGVIMGGDVYSVDDWNTFFELPDNGRVFNVVEVVGTTVNLYGGKNITLKEDLFFDTPHLLGVDDKIGCVVKLDFGCFAYCVGLTKAKFPSLTEISDQCFNFNQALVDIAFPELKTAGGMNFYYCESIVTGNFPKLESAGDHCFDTCSGMVFVNFPLLITAGDGCFQACTKLANVNFPALATVGTGCFAECMGLKSLGLPVCTKLGPTNGNDGVFLNTKNAEFTLTVPSALMTCNAGANDGDIIYAKANNEVTIITV